MEDERQMTFVRPGGRNVEHSYRVVAVGTRKNEQHRISTKSQIDNRIECRWQTTQASLRQHPYDHTASVAEVCGLVLGD